MTPTPAPIAPAAAAPVGDEFADADAFDDADDDLDEIVDPVAIDVSPAERERRRAEWRTRQASMTRSERETERKERLARMTPEQRSALNARKRAAKPANASGNGAKPGTGSAKSQPAVKGFNPSNVQKPAPHHPGKGAAKPQGKGKAGKPKGKG